MKSKNKRLPGATWYSYVFLYGILKPLLFIYFHLFQNVHFHRHGFKVPKGPVFFIGNHHTNWDGFYHCVMFYWRFPHYIVHDEAFKNERYRFVFGRFLGQVARARRNGDAEPVMALKRLAQSGQSVNLFPEGDIHMFGGTLPIDESVAKMVKFIDLPIVLTRVRGAHLRAPRWARYAHHHHIDYEIADVIGRDALRQLSTGELYQRIAGAIQVSAYDDQTRRLRPVWGGHRAEWLELGLYLCPCCHRYESFASKGNYMTCVHCGLTVFVDRYLLFRCPSLELGSRPDEWDARQESELARRLENAAPSEHLFTLADGMCETVGLDAFFSGRGQAATARLYRDRIEVAFGPDEAVIIPIAAIVEANLQYKDVFEIITKDKRIRFYRPYPKWSAYLWVKSVKKLRQYAIIETNL